jgi:nitroreductase
MDFFDAVKTRRSVRRYTNKPVPAEIIHRALDAALLAPNSSNMQTWEFYWIRSIDKKQKLIQACLGQGAAKTAQELLVVVANPTLWKRNQKEMIRILTESNAPKFAFDYYKKLIPFTYGLNFLAPLKWVLLNSIGLFRPIMRRPWRSGNIEEIAIKSAALGAENFMLAISAQGYSTCPMEGLDEVRVKRLLGLPFNSRVVMAISVGEADPERGVYGPQVRFAREWFIKEV